MENDIRHKIICQESQVLSLLEGIGLVNKEFKYGHLEPLLEEKNNIDSTSDSLRNKTTRIFK